jgi:hypothetical protein
MTIHTLRPDGTTRHRTRARPTSPSLRRAAGTEVSGGQFASDPAGGNDPGALCSGRSSHPAGSGGSLALYSAAPPTADLGTGDGSPLSPSPVPLFALVKLQTTAARVVALRPRPEGAPAA